ncbi:MAG: hypothetical protein IT258_19475 [Saprospiraceae bacterium]|nr:hypothetical protein [Saprospiraceae bacterium]
MARRNYEVVIPRQPDDMNKLGKNIIAKHTADGASSPIPATTASLLTDKLTEADNQFTLQKELDRNREQLTEDRNLILGIHPSQTTVTAGTVLFHLTSIRDFLLGHFRGAERNLGQWGFTVNSPKGVVQVEIPRNPDKLTKLVADILKKHDADKEASLLKVFDMAALKTLNDDAAKKRSDAEAANRNKEKATQARNLALGTAKGQTTKTPGTVAYLVRSVRDILLGIYRGQEQKLGDWGFEVNFNTTSGGGSTPTPPPPAPGG